MAERARGQVELTAEVRQFFASVPYLAGLGEEVHAACVRAARRREFARGAVVALEGEACPGLYFVESGWLKAVRSSPDGREQVWAFFGPGEALNHFDVFAGTPNLSTIVALEDSSLFFVSREALTRLLAEQPSLAAAVIAHLAQHAVLLLSLVDDLSLRSVEERLAHFLLSESDGDTVHRRRWLTQSELAARLGTVPDVLNRALRSLSEQGLIAVDRHQIRLLDRQGLADRAEGYA
ncbi:MAG: Crp/Fnr family transcriptional regulator [Anaerolineae bacterium]|nr:Crp/Fnr family transcriptional regulator [Anaerolineae bacterium]